MVGFAPKPDIYQGLDRRLKKRISNSADASRRLRLLAESTLSGAARRPFESRSSLRPPRAGVQSLTFDVGSASQTDSLYGGALGVDYQLTPGYLVGVAVGGSDGFFSVPGRSTSGETTGGHIAFYSLATFGNFYGASSNALSYFTNRTERATGGFGGLASETDRGSFDSNEFRSRLEFGRHFDGFGGTITSFLALEL